MYVRAIGSSIVVRRTSRSDNCNTATIYVGIRGEATYMSCQYLEPMRKTETEEKTEAEMTDTEENKHILYEVDW